MSGKIIIIAAIITVSIFSIGESRVSAARKETITVTANFTAREFTPNERIEMKLSRILSPKKAE